jgi:anti-sigma factor RsiW
MQALGHITTETAERYCLRRLPPAEWLSVQTHAAGCEECRAKLAHAVDVDGSLQQVRADLSAEPDGSESEPQHLAYEQVAAYVDGTLDEVEREIADSHFAVCRDCADDLTDLRRYQTIGVARRTTTAEAAPSGLTATAKTLWQRFSSFSFAPSFGTLLPTAAAASVVAIILLGVWIAVRTSRQPNGNEVVKVNAPKESDRAVPQDGAPSNVGTNAADRTSAPTPDRASPTGVDDVHPPASQQATRAPQQRVETGGSASPSSVIALNDGGQQVTLDQQGNLRGLEGLPASVRQTVRRSLETQRVENPRTLESPGGAGGVLMSGGANVSGVPFALVEPVGKIVHSDRPQLRWKPLEGAVSYTVAIVNANFRVVEQSQALSTTQWTPVQPLARGANYYWQVTATLPDGSEVTSPTSPAPQAKFRVLDESTFDDLKLLEKAQADSHLARGVLYAKAGLMDEAVAEFEKLVKANPRSPVARKLLQSAQKARMNAQR